MRPLQPFTFGSAPHTMHPAYTLWLLPDAHAYERLDRLITGLSSRHGTPRFAPHVTLLSGILDAEPEALLKTERLARQVEPVRASLTRIEYLETYYRCLFFRTDDSAELLGLRARAEALFEHSRVEPFIPHISFLYGSLPVFSKEAIVEELGEAFFMDFRMETLCLVETQRTPEHWRVLATFDLGRRRGPA